MNVGVNYMREHMPSTARIHYAVLDAGGPAPNVVQAKACVRYLIRALDLHQLRQLVHRVGKIAEGAALMTETQMRRQIVNGDANLLGNTPLEQLMHAHIERLGPVPFDDRDREFAAEMQRTMTEEDIASAFARHGLQPKKGLALHDGVYPLGSGDANFVGSTDVGSVSWVVPTVQMRCATYAIGTPGHSWQLVAQGKTPAAHKGLTHVAKVMAATALDCILDPALVASAKEDLARRLDGKPFVNPIPDDVEPPAIASARPHDV
jgi:aminobenzoyl-glutamate utilization protein B